MTKNYDSQHSKTIWVHCIIRHSLRYFRHSGLVIYMSKLPAPSVSMPCEIRILQSPTKEQVLLVLWETVQRSQYTRFLFLKPRRSLCKLRLKSPESTTYLQIQVRALTEISTRTHWNKYTHSPKRVRRTHWNKYDVLPDTPAPNQKRATLKNFQCGS